MPPIAFAAASSAARPRRLHGCRGQLGACGTKRLGGRVFLAPSLSSVRPRPASLAARCSAPWRRWRPRWPGEARPVPGPVAAGSCGRETRRESVGATPPRTSAATCTWPAMPASSMPRRNSSLLRAAARFPPAATCFSHRERRSALRGVTRTSSSGLIAKGREGGCGRRLVCAAGHVGGTATVSVVAASFALWAAASSSREPLFRCRPRSFPWSSSRNLVLLVVAGNGPLAYPAKPRPSTRISTLCVAYNRLVGPPRHSD